MSLRRWTLSAYGSSRGNHQLSSFLFLLPFANLTAFFPLPMSRPILLFLSLSLSFLLNLLPSLTLAPTNRASQTPTST
eukprot:653167-Amorphochlora_amoeboformis.AAC.1